MEQIQETKISIVEKPKKTFEEVSVEATIEVNGKKIRLLSYHKESDYGDYDTDCGIAQEDEEKLTQEEREDVIEYLDTFDWGY